MIGVKFIPTEEQLAFVKANNGVINQQKMAQLLHISEYCIKQIYKSLGHKKKPVKANRIPPEAKDYIRANFRELSNVRLANYINENWPRYKKNGDPRKTKSGAINAFLYHNELKRTKEEYVLIMQQLHKDGQFDYEHEGYKIGTICKRMTLHTLGNDKSGAGYAIKTETGWKTLINHIWEQANGPVPKGQMIVLKDGKYDILERIVLENIELRDKLQSALDARVNLTDNWVIAMACSHQPHMRPIIAQWPEMVELHRARFELNQKLKDNG